MPILPSHVGGSGPRDDLDYEGSSDTVRLRQLCEVLLTSRAKMLGLSQSFAHRLSSLPSDLKSSLVNGLGEIIAHLDSFKIELGDTRLTGTVRLGADSGMEGHFPGSDVVHVEVQGSYRGAMKTESGTRERELIAGTTKMSHPALPAPGGTARRRRRTVVEEKAEAQEQERQEAEELARRSSDRRRKENDAEISEGPYGQLYGHSRERVRRGRSSVELTPAEHEELCFVCVSVFEGVTPARPEGSYEARDAAVGALERAGYVRRRSGKWHPTPSGFEASGLLGAGRLELDP